MTRVDFYILKDMDRAAMYRFACRLATRALSAKTSQDKPGIYMHTNDASQAADLDALLWSYPRDRFVPHDCQAAGEAGKAPVWIGWEEPAHHDQLLINLSDSIPDFFGHFGRVSEIITGERKQLGRERYKFYRDRGYPLYHHELDDWET